MAPSIPKNHLRIALRAVHAGFGIPPRELLGTRRTYPIVEARQALYAILSHRGHSASAITRTLGKRAHGTVTSGINRCWDLCATDRAYVERFNTAWSLSIQ